MIVAVIMTMRGQGINRCRHQMQAAVPHRTLRNHLVRKVLHRAHRPLENTHLEAIVRVEVHMQARDGRCKHLLNRGQMPDTGRATFGGRI